MSTPTSLDMDSTLQATKSAFLAISTLSTEQKNQVLAQFAEIIEQNADFLLNENQKDIEQAQKDELTPSLYQRLKLDASKIAHLVQGIRDLINLPDPAGRVISATQLDDGLVLEKVTVPLGVIGIIFESRPDVIPQILSLILKSGNAVVLKGGREATYSNNAFMKLVDQLNAACHWLPKHWATLLDGREAVQQMLNYPQYVDLVIPRGSNQLVQTIMASTKIPVLGHADGVCHLYVHSGAKLDQAVKVAVDAKTQYPAACNALETLLVDEAIAHSFLPKFVEQAQNAGITLRVCDRTMEILSEAPRSISGNHAAPANKIEPATEQDWRTEYGDLTLSTKVVPSLDAAIEHINHYGSHHTDVILTEDHQALEHFLNAVDSACVFANASSRFTDGFRFGLGAEIGISTAKTHARGPVGLEGLVIYKYKLRGQGQIVADYVGANAKPFQHKALS
jgi:glutamate-5-semialdehyde dehydrogenase